MDLVRLSIYCLFCLFSYCTLRLIYRRNGFPSKYLLIALVGAQFALKIFDRYYVPSFGSILRAGDEVAPLGWVYLISKFQNTGIIPFSTMSEGPGIYYLVYGIASVARVTYVQALIIAAIIFGSLYVLPCYYMYRQFGSVWNSDYGRIALAGTTMISMSDVMVYSTTIARPLLFGLFLLPIAMWALQKVHISIRWTTFALLLTVSMLILLVHAPFTYVVLLLVVTFIGLLYNRLQTWSGAYILALYVLYGLAIAYVMPDLGRIWRVELFGAYPLKIISASLGKDFILIFPVLGLVVLLLLMGRSHVSLRLTKRGLTSARLFRFLVMLLAALAVIGAAGVLTAYSAYISQFYGSMWRFLLFQGWKLGFGVLALLGLRIYLTRNRKISVPIAWIVSLGFLVVILALYTPLRSYPGLSNLDERFAEFLYYPAFYFIGVGLDWLAKNTSPRVFRWIVLPLVSIITIPSLMVGVHDPTVFNPR
jgi:hypothetical protein